MVIAKEVATFLDGPTFNEKHAPLVLFIGFTLLQQKQLTYCTKRLNLINQASAQPNVRQSDWQLVGDSALLR